MNEAITLSRACEVLEIPSGLAMCFRWVPCCGSANHLAIVIPLQLRKATCTGLKARMRMLSGLQSNREASAAQQERFSEEAVWGELQNHLRSGDSR